MMWLEEFACNACLLCIFLLSCILYVLLWHFFISLGQLWVAFCTCGGFDIFWYPFGQLFTSYCPVWILVRHAVGNFWNYAAFWQTLNLCNIIICAFHISLQALFSSLFVNQEQSCDLQRGRTDSGQLLLMMIFLTVYL